MNRNDYIKNRYASQDLANKIRNWWHNKGYTSVQVWVEEENPITDFGTKLPPSYSVRSNINFTVDSISKRMVE